MRETQRSRNFTSQNCLMKRILTKFQLGVLTKTNLNLQLPTNRPRRYQPARKRWTTTMMAISTFSLRIKRVPLDERSSGTMATFGLLTYRPRRAFGRGPTRATTAPLWTTTSTAISTCLPQRARACLSDSLSVTPRRMETGGCLFASKGTKNNPSGIGAQVYATIHQGTPEERTLRRDTLLAMVGTFHQDDLPVHIGLGAAQVVDELRIVWPNGVTQVLTNVSAGQYLEVAIPSS